MLAALNSRTLKRRLPMAETFWVVDDGRLDLLGSGKRYRSEAEARADMTCTDGLLQVIKGLPSEIKPERTNG